MKCSEVKERISRYIDDDLGEEEKKAFVFHIQNCLGCSRELKGTRAVHELLVSAERFSAPYEFTTRVMANVENKGQRVPSHFWKLLTQQPLFLRTVKVAFAALIVAIGIVSGNLIISYQATFPKPATVREVFVLDLFQATPSDSIGGVFASLVEVSYER
jgi:anti-sigma factor RsiW